MEFVQLTRTCPECEGEIVYATRKGLERATVANSMCAYCRGKASRGTLGIVVSKKKERVWNCPDCGEAIVYDTRAGYNYAKKVNLKCNNCKGIHCKGCKVRIKKATKTGYCLDCYQNIYLPSVRIADAYEESSWKRNCPKCGKELVYTTYSGFVIGKKKDSPCAECACPKALPKLCTVCKTNEVSKNNRTGVCKNCYVRNATVEKTDVEFTCPLCRKAIIYPAKNRREGLKVVRENLPCADCRKKARLSIPLLSTCICIVCGGEFIIDRRKQRPRQTCSSKCSAEHRKMFSSYTTAEFIERAKKVHGDTWYDYSKSNYTGVLDKITITCTKHGDFQQCPQDHLTGSGCQKCNASHGERRIRVYLESKKIAYEYQKRFPDCINPKTGAKLSYDFYVPDYNLLIEYDGIQHYQFIPQEKWRWCRVTSVESLEALQERDKLKDQYAKDKGMELLRINFIQKPHIEKVLEEELEALPCRSKSHTLYSQICGDGGTF